jgi:hypothetical protein
MKHNIEHFGLTRNENSGIVSCGSYVTSRFQRFY